MSKKWFASAAVKGSGHENIADSIITEKDITSETLKDIDLLFVKDEKTFLSNNRGFFYTVVTDRHIDEKDQEKFILEHPGNFFISRLGHDIVNLISPFEHYEYIEHDLILNRVRSGNRLGQQVNFIGHLLQDSGNISGDSITGPELVENIETLCRKLNIEVKVVKTSELEVKLNGFMFRNIAEEIVHNWDEHSTGNNKLFVCENSLKFTNSIKRSLGLKRPKAQLRCPFMQKNTGKGYGLGLYILSVTSSKGDFNWNVETDGNYFSLSLLFS